MARPFSCFVGVPVAQSAIAAGQSAIPAEQGAIRVAQVAITARQMAITADLSGIAFLWLGQDLARGSGLAISELTATLVYIMIDNKGVNRDSD